ncbi:sialate O-acetylesterase [Cellulophaga sp. F20128]|uniref:sialate O-acetylesterase n=1 Tax=Cellulophaga sp. F20128 TaxID=2926413 RepID=UPI001FF5D04E|nr:sialate O-acetylesterase [Cellulophaga sp. F20128]MCK0156466.1 sialate O-acetylesterase [Cellulophaga sp. F20128]
MFKKSIPNSFLLIVLFCITHMATAEIKLPSIFGSHMVLQQQTDAAIWGMADPNKNVEVTTSWDGKSYTTKADRKGKWHLKVKTPSAGGPYDIRITDGTPITLTDILIGEVWVCSGQSNMYMRLKGLVNQPVLDANKTIATSTNNEIRFFNVKLKASLEKLDDFSGEWLASNPENAVNFSATAYHFAKMLQEVLQVPVGIVSSSWGGTAIEPWISESGLQSFDWVPKPGLDAKGRVTQRIPAALFNGMIHPMKGFAMKGVLWYQGESNRNNPEKYSALLAGMINNWRNEWNIGEFPFYYVQIAPYNYGTAGLNSALLREAQLQTLSQTTNTGMVSLMDIGEEHIIHPANKQVGGERLAYLALAKTYNLKGIAYSGPVLKEMKIEGSVVKLSFDHAKNGLNTFGKPLVNFKIAGKDKRFYPANATINWQGITLFSAFVKEPVAVRYAFDDFVIGELHNTEGLPASSFRTDAWEVE